MRKVHASKFAISQNGQQVVGRGGLYGALECAADAVAPVAGPDGNAPVAALVQADALVGRLAGHLPLLVCEVLSCRADPQVAAPVVENVAVDVVNHHPGGGIGDYAVEHKGVGLAGHDVPVIAATAEAEPTAPSNKRKILVIDQRDLATSEDEFGHLGDLSKHVPALESDERRDAPALPVLYALDAAGLGIEAKEAGNFGRATEAVDQERVRVTVLHGLITHHV